MNNVYLIVYVRACVDLIAQISSAHFSMQCVSVSLGVRLGSLRTRLLGLGAMATQGARGRELSSTAVAMAPIERVTVIGSGLMGAGIAQVAC